MPHSSQNFDPPRGEINPDAVWVAAGGGLDVGIVTRGGVTAAAGVEATGVRAG